MGRDGEDLAVGKGHTRRIALSAAQKKVKKVMREYESGKLKSSSGRKVKSRKQALAIAISASKSSKAR